MNLQLIKILVVGAAMVLLAACTDDDATNNQSGRPPLAWFTVTPSSGLAPLTVAFDGSSSNDVDGPIVGYAWNFGDGSPPASGVTASHVYQEAGTYTATLSVTDKSGVTVATTRQILVRAMPPTLTFTATPTFVASGQSSMLTWAAQSATSCIASGGWSGTRPTSGSESTPPISAKTSYTLVCTGAGGDVTQTVTVQVNSLSGQILIPSISRVDGDVNDPAAAFRANDTAATAQSLPSPVVVGGYLNEPNRGSPGRSYAAGDLDDVYKVNLTAGQVIELIMPSADPDLPDDQRDDADLGLFDESGQLVDYSTGLGQVEQLTVPSSGNYFVLVTLYSGAPLYRLSIGQVSVTSASTAVRLSEEFVAGEVIVTLKATSGPVAARQKASAGLEATYGLRRKAGDASREMLLAVPESASAVIASRKPQMSGERERGLAVPAELQRKLDTLRYLKLLQSDPNVMTASLNRIVRASAVPNDPGYSLQRWHYELLELPAAWNVTKGSANVVVAVVDSGVVAHPDLVPNLTDGFDFVSNPTNQDGNGIDAVPDDPGCVLVGGSSFHGTHVAGTVSATTSNAAGVAGVGWNTRLMPVRVLDGCSGSGTSYDVAQGIRYAAGLSNDSGTVPSKRADVINLSLGSAGACDPASANLAAAVRAQGVVVVAAAGNDNTSVQHSPASCPNVISVSAVGPTAQRAPYSNYGASWVDVAAPGGDMRLDANGDGQPDGIFSTHARGGGANRYATFELMQGTSMAAPHIAGVIALMKAVKPSLTPGEVDSWLAQGLLTNDIGVAGRDDLGAGLISAAKAVQAAGAPPPVAPPTLTVTPSSLSFGDVGTQAQVVLANSGGGALSVTGIQTSAAWIGVAAAGAGANGLGTYQVTVTRGGLAAGTYSGWVDFSSSAGTRRLSILMQVTPTSSTPEAGRQYVLLLDPQSGDTLAEARVNASGESVAYRFDTVGTGQYLVVAGTDMNNDGYVCDDGEACGAYPVLSRPDIVSVAGERSAVDFSTAFQTNLQAASTAGRERKPAGFQRKP